MALPEGLKIMEPLVPLASFMNEKTKEAQTQYLAASIPIGKAQLAAAIERYGI
jgi:hypothetical protein